MYEEQGGNNLWAAGGGKEHQQNLCFLYFRTVAVGTLYPLFSARNTHAEFVTQRFGQR